ncbi:hypothetical protein SDC9_187325 [bioreactor metagenome]|uniref:Uncharacterized protein n=1 Tax=bioreactor metagenome TaxID=1076179 RepID=A0A645HWT2_9ZZZZ
MRAGRLLRLPERRLQPDRRRGLRGLGQFLRAGRRAPHLQAAGHERRQPRPGRHPGQPALGAPARAQPQRLGVAVAQAHLLPRRPGRRRQRQRQRHGAMAACTHRPPPGSAPGASAGNPAHASRRDAQRDPGRFLAAQPADHCRLRARLARLQLFRAPSGLPRRRCAGLSRCDGAGAGAGPGRGDPLEQRKRPARRPAADHS